MAGVGIQLSFGNILQLLGILSPLILSAFLVIFSLLVISFLQNIQID